MTKIYPVTKKVFDNATAPVYFSCFDRIHDNATDVQIASTFQSGSTFMTDASHFSTDNNKFVVGQAGFYEIYFFDSYQFESSSS